VFCFLFLIRKPLVQRSFGTDFLLPFVRFGLVSLILMVQTHFTYPLSCFSFVLL